MTEQKQSRDDTNAVPTVINPPCFIKTSVTRMPLSDQP